MQQGAMPLQHDLLSLRQRTIGADNEVILRWLNRTGCLSHSASGYQAARMADLVQLEQIASSYGSREPFLTELTLDRTPRARPGEHSLLRRGVHHPRNHALSQRPRMAFGV